MINNIETSHRLTDCMIMQNKNKYGIETLEKNIDHSI